MVFTLLSENEFKKFSEVSCTRNFFQTLNMYKRYLELKFECYLVGVKEKGEVVAAALIVALSKKFLGYKTFNAYKGYLMDYNNLELLNFFTVEIKKFLKTKKALKLYIDPYIVSQERDSKGEVLKGIDNLFVKEHLVNIGYRYIGEYQQVKWTYVVDLKDKTKEEVFKNFKSNTRNLINKTLTKYELNIRKIGFKELAKFKELTEASAEKQGFVDKSLEYYQSMYKHFKDDVEFLVCEMNVKEVLTKLEAELRVAEQRKKRDQDFIRSLEADIADLKKIDQEVLMLAGAMFMFYGDEIVYLFSGAIDKYAKFCGSYALQWYIISCAIDNGYKKYNFYGINPKLDNGVYKFKRGFNGKVEELLGTFELEVSKVNKIYRFLKRVSTFIS